MKACKQSPYPCLPSDGTLSSGTAQPSCTSTSVISVGRQSPHRFQLNLQRVCGILDLRCVHVGVMSAVVAFGKGLGITASEQGQFFWG